MGEGHLSPTLPPAQALAEAAASLGFHAQLVATMALDGATNHLRIAEHVEAVSMETQQRLAAAEDHRAPPPVPVLAQALVVVVAANGALHVEPVALMAQGGATNHLRIAVRVKGNLMRAQLRQAAGESQVQSALAICLRHRI